MSGDGWQRKGRRETLLWIGLLLGDTGREQGLEAGVSLEILDFVHVWRDLISKCWQ